MRLRLLATCFSFLFLIQFIVVVNVRGQQRHPAIPSIVKAASIPSPEDVIGFSPGDDRKLASWNQVMSYFQKLDEASDRVKFQTLGKTTMDAPFVLATISAPENLAQLELYRKIQAQLADPRKLGRNRDERARRLIARGKTIVITVPSPSKLRTLITPS